MVFGKPKGKDLHVENESKEPKKGLSKTEIQALMKKMTGGTHSEPEMPSPLMPNIKKGGARGRPI